MTLHRSDSIAIQISNSATVTERFAAAELEKYLQCILSISLDHNATKRFVVGRDTALCGKEGFRITVTEDCVYLLGSDDGDGYNRGALYAVYEFLERYMGCCFGGYGTPELNQGELIPTYSFLELSNEEYVKQSADLPYRTAIVQFNFWAGNADRGLTVPFIDWLAKNRYNRILTWSSCYIQLKNLGFLEEIEKRGIRLTVGHHEAFSLLLPPFGNEKFPTHYAEEHPEFYRLQPDNTRFLPKSATDFKGQVILCCRNEQCIDTVAANILAWLEENPLVDTIALWPHDHTADGCCCPQCAPYSKTENYLYFEDQVARRVRAHRPDIQIDVLIYMDLWECPDHIQLCDGIRIDQSTWGSDGLRHCGKPDGTTVTQCPAYRNLLSYRQKCRHGVLYDYYMGNFGMRQKLMPCADEMQQQFLAMRRDGLDGSGTQMECFNLQNNLFNFYCFARTAYDTSLSMEDHFTRYARLFGEGGEEICRLLRLFEDTLDGQTSIDKSGKFFIGAIDTEKVYAAFDTALERTKNPVCRNNIRLLRLVFRYSHLSSLDAENDKGLQPTFHRDPDNELAYMTTHFDSYFANYTGRGIAIPTANRTDGPAPNHWYCFE